ncbi:flavodoxin family protein [Paenibacillus sp. UNC499MF]|uniref:flavodoxin family protein n=1 Tax=Paenibacillus sp. UNC499MF TaxID=1502751 RepID=UPI0008A003E8|nr:flavodoxin family protein [Paenibacillus sp. UNC499MF]SEG45748.1 Multimeric flavodoxin WrbA [Paenibacillus sp. UNC499MF]
MTITVIDGGTRPGGNTELLTEEAVKGLNVDRIQLNEYTIRPIIDGRHAEEGFPEMNDDYKEVIDRVLAADVLIFSTPVYWYSMSGIMKNFVDRWSQMMRDGDYPDFKKTMAGKKAFVIAVGGDLPEIKGLPMIQQFQYIFDFMGIRFEGYILGKGNKPGDVLDDAEGMFAAGQLRNKLAALQ